MFNIVSENVDFHSFLLSSKFYQKVIWMLLSNSYTMACPPVHGDNLLRTGGDNPQALVSGLSGILCGDKKWSSEASDLVQIDNFILLLQW